MEQIEGPKGDYSRHTVRVLREEVEQEGRALIDSEIQSLQRGEESQKSRRNKVGVGDVWIVPERQLQYLLHVAILAYWFGRASRDTVVQYRVGCTTSFGKLEIATSDVTCARVPRPCRGCF